MLRPLPETDTDAGAFWQAAAEEKLLIQHCRRCGGYQHYARPFCITCRDADVEMVEAGGTGILHSFTIVHRSPYDDVPMPYVVGLVRLDEGVTLLTNIVGCDPARVTCDMPVEVTYQAVRDGIVIPVFRPRKAG